MSDLEELKRAVESLLRKNNVKLKRLFEPVLQTIAGEFWKVGLIEQEVAESMLVLGVTEFTRAAKLFSACQTLLVLHPRENFPKFIGVLKRFETMKLLAAAMESEFEQAPDGVSVKVHDAVLAPLKLKPVYEEALRKGRCCVKYGHVLLLGAAKAGKTSLTRGLMNKPLQKDQGRTIVADIHTVKPATWAKAGKTCWESVEDEIEELAHLIAVVKPHEELAKTIGSLSAVKQFSSDYAPQIEQMVDTNEEKEARSRKRMEIVEDALSKAKRIAELTVKQDVLLHVWDSGGQRVVLDLLPIFLTSRTMFLFVFNASEKLLANEEIHGSEDSVITLDRMEQWMAMIYCQLAEKNEKQDVPLRYPQIYPIGTHGDRLTEPKKKEVVQKLKAHCYTKYYSTILLQPLIVDNTKAGRGEHEDEGFGRIRKAVSEMVTKELELETPVAWVLFRLLLSKLGRKIVTYTQASKVALDCHISEKECQSALNFYHELGVFLFYSHISSLRDHVITDPKWLVKRLGKLLQPEENPGPDTYKVQWTKLQEKGIAQRDLYEEVWKKSEESDVEPSRLMDLLVTFHLASPVPRSQEHPQEGSYFLPCVLKYNAHFPRLFPHDMKAASLYIVFEAHECKELIKFVPPGFFTRLVTALANDRSSRYKIDFHRVHRRRIYFRADSVNKFTITELPHALEVDATRTDEDQHCFSSFCRELASALDECCTLVLNCYENHRKKMFINGKPAVDISWKFGLLCRSPRCDSHDSKHYCFFVPGKGVFADLRCEQSDVPQYRDDQRYWFTEEKKNATTTSEISAGTPRILAIGDVRIVKSELRDFTKGNWKELGRQLGLSETVLDDIKADYKQEGVSECLVETLKHWLNMNYDNSKSNPPTWSNLANAVEEAGNPAVAKTIREHHP